MVVLSLVGGHAAGAAEVLDGDGIELAADVFTDDSAAGQNGQVFEHRLAAVAEAGGLDGQDIDGAAELVDNEGCQSFAVDILGNDEQVLGDLEDLLQRRQNVSHGGDFLVGDQDVGVFDDRFHPFGVGDEVGG